ncbi:helix-turn-helix domain-containing protein [Methanofollis formosanus]|uniref:Helix-turn-helix domain-containing protein n=1 Tax=Methanofollis formosanus TaxID=299308 RepID=A0A8G0ZZ23_9EURY|nr:XRE family transcriptional regulator [Methanofollis formosanus]QYZ78231.1 helix-turn-helix domain-containing protein [Methanofollis formosanus]
MSIAERIKVARKGAGMSQRDLGAAIGVTAPAISKYEKGEVIPNSRVLILLSEALNVNIDFFFRKVAANLSEPHYRCRKSLKKKEENIIHGKVTDWLERYLEVEMISGITASLVLPSREECRVSTLEDVEAIAQKVRDEWDLGLDPIENVMDVLEQHGIKVGIFEAPDSFDALTFYHDEKTPVIAINKSMTGDRQRYNCAHELGHLILQVEPSLDEEDAAHRFAGAFLVPREMVWKELGKKRRVIDLRELYLLKHKYGMSMKAWIHRARDLGIITKGSEKGLYIRLNRVMVGKEEPAKQVKHEMPTYMHLLILRAMNEKKITLSRARELFGGNLPEIATEVE